MCHDKWGTVTRRVSLALLACLGLAGVGPGCSPAGQASSGAARIPDRLKKMRALRGTGDSRGQGKLSSLSARAKSRSR
jgi:hypothetical protein